MKSTNRCLWVMGLAVMTALAVNVAFAEDDGEQVKKHKRDKGQGRMAGKEQPQELTQEQREARKQEMLKKYDKDGDGQLSEEERKAAFEAHRAERIEERVNEFMKRFDKDGNGSISKEEVSAALEARAQEMRSRAGEGKCGKKGEGHKKGSHKKGNNGLGNGTDDQPPGDPKVNDGDGTGPGNPGNRKGKNRE